MEKNTETNINDITDDKAFITNQIRNSLLLALQDCENATIFIKDDNTGFVHHVETYVAHYIKEAVDYCDKNDMETVRSRTNFVYRNALLQHEGYSRNKDKDDIKWLVKHLEEAIDWFEKY